jgi:type II secretory pathway predicted ATPase ExeA
MILEQHTNPDKPGKREHNPYVGPRSFSQDETLYGRDKEITDLYYLLAAERVVLMYSPSGAGKTSLIQAGLIPRLAQEGYTVLPEQTGEQPQTIRAGILPDRSILSNRYLAAVLLRLAPEAEIAQQEPSELTEAIKKRLSERREGDKRQVLIFDQFEEVLTQDRTDHYTRREFFQQLGVLLTPSPEQPPPLMLFAMREEYIAALEPYRRFIPTQFRNTFRLNLLPLDAAVQAGQSHLIQHSA